jgi:hypothetical protein
MKLESFLLFFEKALPICLERVCLNFVWVLFWFYSRFIASGYSFSNYICLQIKLNVKDT